MHGKVEGRRKGNKGEQYFKFPHTGVLNTEMGISKLIDTKWRESYFLLSAPMWPISEIPCPVLSFQYQRGIDKLKDIQQKINKRVCRWAHVGYEEQLKEQRLLSLEERGASWSIQLPNRGGVMEKTEAGSSRRRAGQGQKPKATACSKGKSCWTQETVSHPGRGWDGGGTWRKSGTSTLAELQNSAEPLSDWI